jgi:hypothetical protein
MDESAVNGIRKGLVGRRVALSEDAVGSMSLDRMGPILRDLVAFDLVERTETGAFVLRPEVQRWLAEASVRSGAPGTAEVFVGRQCQRCGAIAVTRIVDGVRICAPCQATPVAEVLPDEPSHHARWWRAKKAG